MSVLQHLHALARGARPADQGLLSNARCAWGQAKLHAEDAILAAFAAKPFALEDVVAVETKQAAALVGGDEALVADVYDGRIGRLWRVGVPGSRSEEPVVDVAFDPDMRQERGDLNFRSEDHPELDPSAEAPLIAALRDVVEQERIDKKLKVRAFSVRAFGDPSASVALVSLFSLSNDRVRSAGFSYAAVAVGAQGVRAIVERPPARRWTAHH